MEAVASVRRELVGSGGVLRVDSADAMEGARVALEDAGEITVVPLVVDDLDDDGPGDAVGLHEFKELFDEASSREDGRRGRRERRDRASRRGRGSR